MAKVLELQLQYQSLCYRKGDPFQGLKLGSCLTHENELSEETHVLTKGAVKGSLDSWLSRAVATPCGGNEESQFGSPGSLMG